MKNYILILIICLLTGISACDPPDTEIKLEGLWMGNYQHELYEFPLSMMWYFENDSLVREWTEGNDTSFEWILSGDILQIDTTEYVMRAFKSNQIKIEKKWEIVFDKVVLDTTLIDLKGVNEIKEKTWQLKQKKPTQFCYTTQKRAYQNDTLYIQRRYWYDNLELGSEVEKKCASWHSFKDHWVLLQSGKWSKCDSLYAPLELLIESNQYGYTTLTSEDKKLKRLEYIETDTFSINHTAFGVCDERVAPYYNRGLEYEGGTRQLKKEIWEKFNKQQYGAESGYITIRFVINCAGKAGRFEIEQTNLNFEPIKFDKHLVKHLFLLTQSLNQWKTGKDKEGNLKDSRKFLTYKIENGWLKEILP